MTDYTKNSIVRCSFRICFYYFLKYFMLNGISYNNKITEQIDLIKESLAESTDSSDNEILNKTNRNVVPLDVMSMDDADKLNIIKDRYKNQTDQTVYALKISSIGQVKPLESDLKESEIIVNTKTKQFYVKSDKTLNVYSLPRKSIVKCEKN